MNRFFALYLTFTLCFTLSACGQSTYHFSAFTAESSEQGNSAEAVSDDIELVLGKPADGDLPGAGIPPGKGRHPHHSKETVNG